MGKKPPAFKSIIIEVIDDAKDDLSYGRYISSTDRFCIIGICSDILQGTLELSQTQQVSLNEHNVSRTYSIKVVPVPAQRERPGLYDFHRITRGCVAGTTNPDRKQTLIAVPGADTARTV